MKIMLAITAKPLTDGELKLIKMNETEDTIIEINGWRCRYMRPPEGCIMEVDHTYYDYNIGAFGLQKVSEPNAEYDYFACKIKE